MSEYADYENFSLQAIQEGIRQIVEDVKAKTGATDEEINVALGIAARSFMEINMFKEPERSQIQTSGPKCESCGAFTTYARVNTHGLCLRCEPETNKQ